MKTLLFCLLIFCLPNLTFGNEMFIGIAMPINSLPDFSKSKPWARLNIYTVNEAAEHKFRIQENHHLYLGILLTGIGQLTHNKPLKTLGGIIVFDDLVQHVFKVQTPLHLLNNWLWSNRNYQNAARFTDALFR